MSVTVVVGSQWGDEGKGKIVDYLSKDSDVIARYQGGDNAGHTIVFNDHKFSLQLLPSGIFYSDKLAIIGNGVVLNPKSLFKEMKYLNDNGVTTDNLRISSRAQVIMPYHILLDELSEKDRTNKIGTTKKGIGPAYMDKIARVGIRVADLIHPESLKKILSETLRQKNQLLTKLYGVKPLDFETMYEEYKNYGQQMKKYVTDTSMIINEMADNKNVLFEGAQGIMLDIDHGTYPYVTSSNPVAGGAAVGAGIGPTKITDVIGVCKAYTSRVGEGPFPTELLNEIGNHIRDTAHEYGTVTKRPRRIGWLDTVALRHAARVSGLTSLAMNCVDVLDELDTIKVCTGYELNGKIIDYYPANLDVLDQCKPIYQELPGWKVSTTECTIFEQLPQNAQNYIKTVEKLVNVPIDWYSVGPDREQTHKR
ncbi:adenylosuccinate synthase [Fructilactobacillus lindneri]|uniref:Adenylosuccinate synthetase n=2 Tax=Fructilactobacillus lindneri TaxID=53444 RepID=A0A0R2JVN2_9LACO|nr:adenylosuccinate synthase [Fructilactobacillus lindneri]ANZ57797.1 adenylosuccinate synthase [Fructilactobacillus lindneri]ANZ59066.1 adenylosuccinate synthase [Fructilactobacillus lindneri]KRN78762.1 adenylosuccinate synthetase [Fructilactobacillus lindneri DSM 20690 = JCM 11027]POG98119.1 adenylosuccinate synthase [Fructilactobacillus lindneri]POH01766.1 adenylosuccinate synthase [Fructilactobacillus lindneri]